MHGLRRELDGIDRTLLAAIEAHPDQHIAEALRGYTLLRDTQIYARIRQLAAEGFIELDRARQRGRVFGRLTDSGKKALTEARPCTE